MCYECCQLLVIVWARTRTRQVQQPQKLLLLFELQITLHLTMLSDSIIADATRLGITLTGGHRCKCTCTCCSTWSITTVLKYDVSMVRQCFMPFAFYMYVCMAECIRAQNCSNVKPGGNKSFCMCIVSCIHSTLGLHSAIHGKLAYLEYVAVCTVPQSVRPMRLMACVQTL